MLNTVRGWLRAEGRRPRGGDAASFSTRVRVLYVNTPLPSPVERQLRTIEALTKEIADADRDLAVTAKADAIARRENSSAERQRPTSITKAGPPALRWCLVQAAWAARRARRKATKPQACRSSA